MKKFPAEKVPKSNTEGANYRSRQIFFQLPKQDYNIKYAHFINDDKSMTSFNEMKKRQFKDAVGIGNAVHFFELVWKLYIKQNSWTCNPFKSL